MEKKINYLARSYNDIKSELLNFSEKYYPEISDNLNDASVGSWLVDLISVVGDNLSYHADRMYQENNINSSSLKSSLMNNARLNGIHVPGAKASMCEVELSCTLPVNSQNISSPDWNYAPILRMGSVVGNSNYQFELTEDVDFSEQFNKDGVSNRKYAPKRNNNGNITHYVVTKTAIVIGGKNKIYEKVLSKFDVYPFMEIVLPEENIMNVESIIFKESSDYTNEPKSYEFYIDEEEYKLCYEEVNTYRFFEVESLSDQYIFGIDNGKKYSNININNLNAEGYEDYSDGKGSVTRYYKGAWKPITQKFITEYTDKGYLKIIFGSGSAGTLEKDSNDTQYGKNVMSKIINNDLLGVLPKVGWTMFVLYRTGGGAETNLGQGAINTIIHSKLEFPKNSNDSNTALIENSIRYSLSVKNVSPSVGGKDFPTTEELKNYIKYAIQEQKRCVTVKDYKTRLMMMPSKFGCPFRCNAIEENNKVIISCLGLDFEGHLDDGISETLKNNMIEYLKNYKSLGDYVEFRSGKIYNLGFQIDVMINENYNKTDIVEKIINIVKERMKVSNHDMGENIFIGDLQKEINNIDGVLNLIDLKVYSIYNGDYSATPCPLPGKYDYDKDCNAIAYADTFKSRGDSDSFMIDLKQIDNVLYSDYNSMFEIFDPESDIVVRTKTKN